MEGAVKYQGGEIISVYQYRKWCSQILRGGGSLLYSVQGGAVRYHDQGKEVSSLYSVLVGAFKYQYGIDYLFTV